MVNTWTDRGVHTVKAHDILGYPNTIYPGISRDSTQSRDSPVHQTTSHEPPCTQVMACTRTELIEERAHGAINTVRCSKLNPESLSQSESLTPHTGGAVPHCPSLVPARLALPLILFL